MAKRKNSCKVHMLDGTEIIIDDYHQRSCKNLFEYVCEVAKIKEKQYFGLRYIHPQDGNLSWLNFNKPLSAQVKKASEVLHFGAKVYPLSLHLLRDEVTRYNFVLQIREKIFNGDWKCSEPSEALLASYLVQAEFGNYQELESPENYLNGVFLKKKQSDDFLEKVKAFHQKHHDLLPVETDWLYLETSRKLSMFGFTTFNVTDCKNNGVKIGINLNGLHVFFKGALLHTFGWSFIKRANVLHKKEISIEIATKIKDLTIDTVLSFLSTSQTDAKRFVRTCDIYQSFLIEEKERTKENLQHGLALQNKMCEHTMNDDTSRDLMERVDTKTFNKRFENLKVG